MHATLPRLNEFSFPSIDRRALETLQVNLGYKCNQACLHCHVNAGPTRTEMMDAQTIESVVRYLKASKVAMLDLTGGAPELNVHFRDLVKRARAMGVTVMDRCNLTILEEAGQEDLAEFLAANQVEITASLPCYLEDNVNQQRGDGVFEKSIFALRRLNRLGYGVAGSGLILNLVYNPQGAVLPPDQKQLEGQYRAHLTNEYSVSFNKLFTLTNMPIQRFGSTLISKGQFNEYMQLLRSSFQEHNLESVMCRSLLSVDWQGFVYDCDFNQMLGLPLEYEEAGRIKLDDLLDRELTGNRIAVRDHCFGCTAGQGSSCGGALDAD